MERLEILEKAKERAVGQVRESAALGDSDYESLKLLPAEQAIKKHAKAILIDATYDIDNKDS